MRGTWGSACQKWASKVSASFQKRLLMTMGAGGSSPAALLKGRKRVVGEEELVGEVGEGMIGGSIVGDGGRRAEVSTDVGSESRRVGDTILEWEDREEVVEGAGEEEEADDGGDGHETPATAGEREAHKAHSSYSRGNNQSEWRSTE